MFEGANSIELNAATVKKAIEYWLNTQCLDALAGVTVFDITTIGNNGALRICFEPLPGSAVPVATNVKAD